MLWIAFFSLKGHSTQHIHLRRVLSTSWCVLDCSYVFRNQQFTHRLKGRCHLLFWPILVHLLVDTYIFIWTFSCGSGAETAYPSGTHKFTSVLYLSFFYWPLCCLSFFDCRLFITHLVSSNFSYKGKKWDIEAFEFSLAKPRDILFIKNAQAQTPDQIKTI